MNINEVKLIDLVQHEDDRGQLYEVVHNYEMPSKDWLKLTFNNVGPDTRRFGQIYVVSDWGVNTIRGLHRHQKLFDYFHIIHGSAKFVLIKDEPAPHAPDALAVCMHDEIVMSNKKPQLLIVPPRIYHGWVSLEPDTILLSVASELYDKENPDEERIPYNKYEELWGDLWKVNPR